MKNKRPIPSIENLLKDIERWVAKKSSSKEKIGHMKSEVEKLGGKKKKYFISLKHRFLVSKKMKKNKFR